MARLRWLLPALVLLVWLGAAGPLGSLSGRLTGLQENDTAAFLPDSAESTRVADLQQGFSPVQAIPAILLWEGDGPLDAATLQAVAERSAEAARIAEDAGALSAPPSPPIQSADGVAVQVLLPLDPEVGDELVPLVADLRATIAVEGTDTFVTGPGGIFADFANGFAGIDGLLLVAGAATDYGLLLVARFREELRRERSKYAAMRIALRRSWEPIVASGATVVLGVLCLLFSDLASNRGLGPISAVSVTLSVIAALTFLPAALVLLGRAAFWPFRPRYGVQPPEGRGWQRVAT